MEIFLSIIVVCHGRPRSILSRLERKVFLIVREINANANVIKLHGLAAKDIRTLLKGGSACARSWLSQDDGRVTEGPTMQNASVVDSH